MSNTAELYQLLIMDRSKNPRFSGRLEVFDAEGTGENPMCGDHLHVFLKRDGALVATQVAHESRGCAIMTASADLMAEAVAGKTVAEVAEMRKAFEAVVTTGQTNAELGNLNALAGVSEYRSRIRCATLPWSALGEAMEKDSQHG